MTERKPQQGAALITPDRLVTCAVMPSIPPRVGCELTKVGRSLLEPVNALSRWVRTRRAVIQHARRRFEATGKHR
jgi:DNA-binding HxlR family transcriptional regulator